MTDSISMTLDEATELALSVLTAHGLSFEQARPVARVMVAGQRDECNSHGLYRLIMCVKTLRAGRIVKDATPVLHDVSAAIARVDAGYGFSPLAFELGSAALIDKAKRVGIAALAINRCFHFSALWPEVEALADAGLAAIAMTPSHSWVAPAGGSQPLFGTNPIAFAWPRPGGLPFVFDFATSAIARGDIELHRREGKTIPLDWAIDASGQPTDDPASALRGAMRTFGGHKGSALSAMIELLAGPLIGDLLSFESQALDAGAEAAPCHGELVIAFDPARFAPDFASDGPESHARRAEALFERIVGQGARLPSQRRFDARERSLRDGLRVPRVLYNDLLALAHT